MSKYVFVNPQRRKWICKCKSYNFVYLCFEIHKFILYKCDNYINASLMIWRKCLKKCTIILCVT